MPDKLMRLRRNDAVDTRRPVMLAIAGDSAAGKTTLTRGIAEALGADRATALCVDDYHRYDRDGAPRRAVHRAQPGLQLHRDHGAAPAAAGPRAPHPEAGLRPLHRPAGPPGAGGAARLRDRGGPAAPAHQAGPRLLRHHRLPRPARGDPAGVEAPPRHRRARLHAGAGARGAGAARAGVGRLHPAAAPAGRHLRPVRAGRRAWRAARHPAVGGDPAAAHHRPPRAGARAQPTTTGGPCT